MPGLAPRDPFDASAPNPARLYDYLAGGKENYAADRAAGDEIERLFPGMTVLVGQQRVFARHAARRLADRGVGQFIDVACGTAGPAVGEIVPAARVAYVDSDPTVATHLRALLCGESAAVVELDVTQPSEVLGAAGLRRVIDLAEPVGVLLCGILSAMDADAAREAVKGYAAPLKAGSAVAACCVSYADQDAGDEASAAYKTLTGDTWYSHSRETIAGWFDGLELEPPGVGDVRAWWKPVSTAGRDVAVIGGVGILG